LTPPAGRRPDLFVERFREVVGAAWRRTLNPGAVVDTWRSLVELCERGYDDNIYEYDNDLAIRDLIEKLLTDSRLSAFPESQWFRAEIGPIDDRFRALLQAEPLDSARPWWRGRIPRRAGAELAEDFRDVYGRSVEVVSG
jgi:hypothetical protein